MIEILPKDFFVRPPTMDDLLVVHKLIEPSFAEFYRRSKNKVGLGVDSQNLTGATRLYERAGMRVARIHITYEKELRAGIELSTQAAPV